MGLIRVLFAACRTIGGINWAGKGNVDEADPVLRAATVVEFTRGRHERIEITIAFCKMLVILLMSTREVIFLKTFLSSVTCIEGKTSLIDQVALLFY